MAIFEYKCSKCENKYEKVLNIKKETTKCPECNNDGKVVISLISKPKHSSDSWN